MKYEIHKDKTRADWLLLLIYFVLVFLGLFNIYSVNFDPYDTKLIDFGSKHGKQLIFIGIALLLGYTFYLFDNKFFQVFAVPLYAGSMLLLLAVLFFGKEIAGNKSWIDLGFISLQPSEFAKFTTAIMIAQYLSNVEVRFSETRTKLILGLIIGIPVFLIMLQGDAGSALVFSSFLMVFYREGMPVWILWMIFAAVILFLTTLIFGYFLVIGVLFVLTLVVGAFFYTNRQVFFFMLILFVVSAAMSYSVGFVFNHVLKPHQKIRIEVLLGMKEDLKGAGYNVHQSKIAIGSGGAAGKGFLKGTQTKGDFVPEQATDFIFCTIGEEWGWLGSVGVLGLFSILLIRLVQVAERQRNKFSRIYVYGVTGIFFFHFMVNIGMTIGLMPVIGIPLPFFSYGGSSLISFTVLLFVLLKQDANRVNEFPTALD